MIGIFNCYKLVIYNPGKSVAFSASSVPLSKNPFFIIDKSFSIDLIICLAPHGIKLAIFINIFVLLSKNDIGG
jgi:hypothetical protein